jgi:predicted O-methyltransferase YrrM
MLWDLARTVKEGGLAVEIGLQFGRSATVIGCAAKENNFKFIAIDNWEEEYSVPAKEHVEKVLLGELELPISIIVKDSKYAWKELPELKKIDLLHIDGDHTYEAVLSDCKIYLPLVKEGGYACFDDFGHDSLPDVFKAVTEYMGEHSDYWEFVGRFGDKLGVFKRVGGPGPW